MPSGLSLPHAKQRLRGFFSFGCGEWPGASFCFVIFDGDSSICLEAFSTQLSALRLWHVCSAPWLGNGRQHGAELEVLENVLVAECRLLSADCYFSATNSAVAFMTTLSR